MPRHLLQSSDPPWAATTGTTGGLGTTVPLPRENGDTSAGRAGIMRYGSGGVVSDAACAAQARLPHRFELENPVMTRAMCLTLVVASAPCTCADAVCTCLAEGYAKCHGCGFLRQVWPREVVVHWAAAEVAKTA